MPGSVFKFSGAREPPVKILCTVYTGSCHSTCTYMYKHALVISGIRQGLQEVHVFYMPLPTSCMVSEFLIGLVYGVKVDYCYVLMY